MSWETPSDRAPPFRCLVDWAVAAARNTALENAGKIGDNGVEAAVPHPFADSGRLNAPLSSINWALYVFGEAGAY
jgi:hypothetical protein